MWSFEGEYKRKPKQKLSGASNTLDRASLLHKLKSDREERETQRKQELSAIKIQAFWRGSCTRQFTKQILRKQCDEKLARLQCGGFCEKSVKETISLILRIFDLRFDGQRVHSLCQLLVKEQKILTEWIITSYREWAFLLPKLACTALRLLFQPSHSFYKYMVDLLICKVPEVYDPSSIPPILLADSLLNLMAQPLFLVKDSNNSEHLQNIVAEICRYVMGQSSYTQVRNFLLPALQSNGAFCNQFKKSLLQYMASNINSICSISELPYMLLSFLKIISSSACMDFDSSKDLKNYLHILSNLLSQAVKLTSLCTSTEFEDSDEDDEARTYMEQEQTLKEVSHECITIINENEHVLWLIHNIEKHESPEVLLYFSYLLQYLLAVPKFKLHQCRMLYSLVARKNILRNMWQVIMSLHQGVCLDTSTHILYGFEQKGTPLLQLLACGSPLAAHERDILLPLLSSFCAIVIAVLLTLHDSELLGECNDYCITSPTPNGSLFPFSVDEIIKISALLKDVCVGLAELAHPDSRMSSAFFDTSYRILWLQCFKVCVSVVQQLHARDTRRRFCPKKHWLSSRFYVPRSSKTLSPLLLIKHYRRQRNLFMPQQWHTKDELLSAVGPPMSLTSQRCATALQELPFVFPFEARTYLFSSLVAETRSELQHHAHFNVGPMIKVNIRRTHIYEDAFEKLSPENERDLKLMMRIQLTNMHGLEESGIDGGGIFREFLSELLKTAFDPNRGFFLLTLENTLYPNPAAELITPDFKKHYFFIGRMLGKALYENLLVEIPLAGFFLSKLLSRSSSNVDFHYLETFDPELCKNLLYLKTYEGDARELALDFTVLNSALGKNTIEELILNGSSIPVTNENKIEYIYRVADYKLNKQIAKQCQAFKSGLYDVVSAEWLQLFDWRELQMLISGSFVPIDIEDLLNNTVYRGEYDADHPTIKLFWQVVHNFGEEEKRLLLKFVTSCSRPPLLGFKDLHPAFCIQPSGNEERLPSAFTCMNLLKLPMYKDKQIMEEKLLYAIKFNTGFELS